MADLDALDRGTLIAGRYRLEEQVQPEESRTAGAVPPSSRWRAVDTSLDRDVDVLVLSGAADGVVDEVLDAARRASLVEDPRLLRVLDIGTDPFPADGPGADDPGTDDPADDAPSPDGTRSGYVVLERAEGRSLASWLEDGPLPAEQVRTVVGEAAQALARADAAGLHHTALDAGSVHVTRDGGVRVAGVAVEAALRGRGPDDEAGAPARADAVALVRLVYAGLTGHWPGGPTEGLPGAPTSQGQPSPPADLVPSTPNDLDTLCAVTLGPHEDGPRTPGELAEQLAPWNRTSVPVDDKDAVRQMRPPARFPVSLAGTREAVGAAAAVAVGRTSTSPSTDPFFDVPTSATGGSAATAPAPATGRSRQALVVLALITALVVVALVWAVNTLSTIGGGDDPAPVVASPAAEEPTAAPEEPAPETEPAEEPVAEPTVPPAQIQGVRPMDPQGDGSENDGEATLAIDDDAGTAWPSETYASAPFGNLKEGVGFLVDLGRESALSRVALRVEGSGGAVEIRVSENPELEGSTVVAEAQLGENPVEIPLEEGLQTRYVILWFTEAPQVSRGDYRVELATVVVG